MISKSRLKNILSLKRRKVRSEKKMFLIEGYRLCQEALQSEFTVETLLVYPELLSPQKFVAITQLARNYDVDILEIEKPELNRLADTVHSQGVFCIVRQKKYDLEFVLKQNYKFIVVIDAGQDPGNVGTIIRSCDWFGIDAVVLIKGTVELYNSKVIRSTMGSIFHLPIVEGMELDLTLAQLKKHAFHIFAAAANGAYPYHQIDYPTPLALVVGNENRGIDHDFQHFDKIITIPGRGRAESLNMATAAAIIISRMVNDTKNIASSLN